MTLPTRARVDDGLRACRHRFGASVVSLAVSNGFGTIAKVEYSAGGTDEFMLPDPHGAVWVEPSADQKAGSSKPSAAGSAAQHASGQGGDGLSSDDDELGSMIDESSSSFTVGVPKRKRKRKRREHAADLPDGDVWVQVSPSPIRAPPPPPCLSARHTGPAPKLTACNCAQCDRCEKWRRLQPGMAAHSLPDSWSCAQNEWDARYASCRSVCASDVCARIHR